MGQTQPLIVYFCSFLYTMTNIEENLTIDGKRVDSALEFWTQDCGMVGADESNEQGDPQITNTLFRIFNI